MPRPEFLNRNRWTEKTALAALPLLVWCAKNGRTITYGQLDQEIVNRGLGHHVMAVQYGYPAGAVGSALIETEEEWGSVIPPLNVIVVNAKDRLPGKGVNYYLERYYEPDQTIQEMSPKEKKAIMEEIQADVFAYEYWDDILEEYDLEPIDQDIEFPETDEEDVIDPPKRGGWSSEPESQEHKSLKEYIAKHPEKIGLPKNNKKGNIEYIFASGDKADIVFETKHGFIGVEVKSIKSNDADLNRGIFQAIKYQALLRAEQKALNSAPNARAVLVTERELPLSLQNLADRLGIETFQVIVNKKA